MTLLTRTWLFVSLLWICSACISNNEQENERATKVVVPPMGWNSWTSFGTDVTEDLVISNIDFVAEHLKKSGYEYIILDMGWYLSPDITTFKQQVSAPSLSIDKYGRLIPDSIKFPSSRNGKGLKPLADYVHGKGLKFGIHIMRGAPWKAAEENCNIEGTDISISEIIDIDDICEWNKSMYGFNHHGKGAQEYYNSIISMYAKWGVDYIKVDDISRPYRAKDIEYLRESITRTGRNIFLSFAPGVDSPERAHHLKKHADAWRISNDIWDNWELVKKQFVNCRAWQSHINSGNFPDCDALPFGKLRVSGGDEWVASILNDRYENIGNELSRLSHNEQLTMMTLWCMFKSPLMIGGHLPEIDARSLSIISRPELISINQNSTKNYELRFSSDYSIWIAEDSKTQAKYMAFFNLGQFESLKLTCTWKELKIKGKYRVFDIWEDEDKDPAIDQISAIVPAHGVKLYKLTPYR